MQGWWNTKHNKNWEKQKLTNSFVVHGSYNFVHEDKMEHYILAIVSLRYARKMQVGSLAELLYTLLRKKKFQTLKQISHCRTTSLQSWSVFLVLTPHWAKIKCLLAKENGVCEELTHGKQTREFRWLSSQLSWRTPPRDRGSTTR